MCRREGGPPAGRRGERREALRPHAVPGDRASATIPATTHPALTTAFGEATLSRFWSSCCSPACSASGMIGTRPATDRWDQG